MEAVVIIPAYQPGAALVPLAGSLLEHRLEPIIVVDDGSGPEYESIFHQIALLPGVTLLRHAVNLGKGAALKTAINHVLVQYPRCRGAVTADADGQHEPQDILAVARRFLAEPSFMVLGTRHFEGPVPWRSWVGNRITKHVVRWLTGQRLSDTQTGLRAIPRALLPRLLRIQSSGYEFELDMLTAAQHNGVRVVEQPIKTVYQPGNVSSHFDPLTDSLKIYFVLVRFTIVSLLSAALDNGLFILAFRVTDRALPAQMFARILTVCFNYPMARKAVFLSDASHKRLLPRYALLVLCSGTLSYILAQVLNVYFGYGVILAKTISETCLFLFNFAIQRDFVFTASQAPPQPR